MNYTVIFTLEAQDQLVSPYRNIAKKASAEIAMRYTDAIVKHCEALTLFPHRSTMRDDIRPGLRISNYRKRSVIAFAVQDDRVAIIGVFYGRQDYAAVLHEDRG